MGAMQDSVEQHGRTLIVMRHAKAGELPGGPDFERALRPRGQRDSAAAGRWLAARGLYPGLVLCSAARRTRQTWQHLSGTLLAYSAAPEPEFVAEQRLYEADSDDVAELVRQTSDDITTVLYIGHNPAAAELVQQLTGAEPAFPTAAIAVIGVRSDWPRLTAGGCELTASWTPHHGDSAG
jgi:phosphohistidine phosphatase